jgi:hypothetical protein
MSKIHERLNALRPYVIGIRYLQGIQLVDAVLKEGWTVPESQLIQRERVDGEENYYMFFSDGEDIDIDDLLDYVQEVINLNIEREKKYELLKVKVAELQKIFKDSSLSKLQRLKFTFNEPDIIPALIDMEKIGDESATDLIEKTAKEEIEIEVKQVEPETPKIESRKSQKNNTTKKTQIHNDIELPPKGEKIELEEYIEPTNIVCKCGPEEICPICEEEKDLTY